SAKPQLMVGLCGEGGYSGRPAEQPPSGAPRPPRLGAPPAERQTYLSDGSVLDPRRGSDRNQRELIRFAIPELQVDRPASDWRRGYFDRSDQLAVLERVLAFGGVPGQQEEVVDRSGPGAGRPATVHDRVERD